MTEESKPLEELIAEYEEFDLQRDGKIVMMFDAKDKLKPLVEALQARITKLERENESLKAQLARPST
jgi:hypothetical protein